MAVYIEGSCDGLLQSINAFKEIKEKRMIKHVVIFHCKPDVAQKTLLEVLDSAREVLPSIPGVSTFNIGLDKGLQPGRSGDFAIVADFDSVENVQEYLENDIHIDFVKNVLTPIVEKRISVQFEF